MDCSHPLLAVALCAGLCHAQFSATFPGTSSSYGNYPALGPGSSEPVLVDPRKLQVSQSVTIASSYCRGASITQSLYENQLAYRLSDPLTLHLGLGILAPLQSSGMQSQGAQRGVYFLPDVGFDYRLSESLLFAMRYCSPPATSMGSLEALSWR